MFLNSTALFVCCFRMIYTTLTHPTVSRLSHRIWQTSNTTYITFGVPGMCFRLTGLGLPLRHWSTNTCRVVATSDTSAESQLKMAICSFAPGRDLHYWYMEGDLPDAVGKTCCFCPSCCQKTAASLTSLKWNKVTVASLRASAARSCYI